MPDAKAEARKDARQRRKNRAIFLSITSNSFLILLKLVIGISIGSIAIISEAIHSLTDLMASFIALFGVKKSGKPADQCHPFGHGKLENLSGTIEALLIFGAAGWIIYEATHSFLEPHAISYPAWGVGVMLFSAVLNFLVSGWLFRVGKETESPAVHADAWHLRTDVYTSLGVSVGLGIIWLGGAAFPQLDLYWIDPLIALGVALLILHAAFKLIRESGRDLLDASLPQEEEQEIANRVQAFSPQIKGYHALRTRRSGSERLIDLHIQVDADMSVEEAHRLTEEVSRSIQDYYFQSKVIVHVEPCNGNCTQRCLDGCLMEDEERNRIHRSFLTRQ